MYDNYHSDHRVRARRRGKWYKSIDKGKMVAIIDLYDPDTDSEDIDVRVPIRFEVCPTCDGKGTHTNPSIDCNGLTAEDFAEDPDFMEDYMRGRYDEPCYECGGDNVVPVCADEQVMEKLIKQWEEEDELEAMYEAERRMGA